VAAAALAVAGLAAPVLADGPPSFNSAPAKETLPALVPAYRDPVLPPLPDPADWHEILLSVELNGQPVSEGGLFVEAGDGRLAAQLALVEAWRIRTDLAQVVTFAGEPYYPLDAIQGATWSLDRNGLSLALDVPPAQFAGSTAAAAADPRLPPVPGSGAFFDYDFLLQAGDGLDQGLGGLIELGGFHAGGTGSSGFLLQDLTSDPEAIRLDSTLARDFLGTRTTLRLGDTLATGGALAPPVRMAGIQYATNFATDPAFVTFPLPSIGGLARQQSVVDVFIDNVQREARSVPPGPFALESLPVVTGAGEVQLRVTDLLGREQLITQSYYVSSRLLKPGLHDFGYELGAVRRNYGQESFDYGAGLASATHRYGFSDRFTGEAHGELQYDQQTLALGGSYLMGEWGVVSGGAGVGHSDGGPGVLGQLAYEYDARRFNFGARTRYTSDGYREAGGDEEAARVDQLSLGLDFADYGRAGLLLLNTDGRDTEDATTLAATYSLSLGPGSLTFRAAQLFRPDEELALTAIYTIPLGERRSASMELLKRSGDYGSRATFRQTRGASDLGLDYRLAAEAGTRDSSVEARFGYQTAFGAADLAVERYDGDDALRAGINGSVAVVDGELAVSRRIDRAFGLVNLPGFPDVRVYLDNREVGRTDAAGRLLLPGLRPYEGNRVRLEIDDLPLDAEITTAEVEAVPFDRSGMTIAFPLARSGQATAILLDEGGAPLPAGLRLRSADGQVTAWVARDGFTQITGIGPAPVSVAAEVDGMALACTLPAAPTAELLPDLGAVRCR
jgi:outer membrane usher protein